MAAVTEGAAITYGNFGTALTNNTAAVANYNVFAVTVNASSLGINATFPFIRGRNADYFLMKDTGAWGIVSISLSGNNFTTSLRYGGSSATAGSAGSASISQIRGVG